MVKLNADQILKRDLKRFNGNPDSESVSTSASLTGEIYMPVARRKRWLTQAGNPRPFQSGMAQNSNVSIPAQT
jgi:inorganic pyrophosphatase/exopolyphosphatase